MGPCHPSFVYGTGEGQTAKVAGRIGDDLATHRHDVEAVDVTEADPDLDVFDTVPVGASIHAGRHQKAVRK